MVPSAAGAPQLAAAGAAAAERMPEEGGATPTPPGDPSTDTSTAVPAAAPTIAAAAAPVAKPPWQKPKRLSLFSLKKNRNEGPTAADGATSALNHAGAKSLVTPGEELSGGSSGAAAAGSRSPVRSSSSSSSAGEDGKGTPAEPALPGGATPHVLEVGSHAGRTVAGDGAVAAAQEAQAAGAAVGPVVAQAVQAPKGAMQGREQEEGSERAPDEDAEEQWGLLWPSLLGSGAPGEDQAQGAGQPGLDGAEVGRIAGGQGQREPFMRTPSPAPWQELPGTGRAEEAEERSKGTVGEEGRGEQAEGDLGLGAPATASSQHYLGTPRRSEGLEQGADEAAPAAVEQEGVPGPAQHAEPPTAAEGAPEPASAQPPVTSDTLACGTSPRPAPAPAADQAAAAATDVSHELASLPVADPAVVLDTEAVEQAVAGAGAEARAAAGSPAGIRSLVSGQAWATG